MLPPRPSTRGDGTTNCAPLRRATAPSSAGVSGSAPVLPRVGSSGSGAPAGLRPPLQQQQQQQHPPPTAPSYGARPPLWGGATSSAGTSNHHGETQQQQQQQQQPRPGSQQAPRHPATTSSSGLPPAPASLFRRPGSQQQQSRGGTASGGTRPAVASAGTHRAGGNSSQEFHRGLVSALQDVLRQQRQGIFPTPSTTGEYHHHQQQSGGSSGPASAAYAFRSGTAPAMSAGSRPATRGGEAFPVGATATGFESVPLSGGAAGFDDMEGVKPESSPPTAGLQTPGDTDQDVFGGSPTSRPTAAGRWRRRDSTHGDRPTGTSNGQQQQQTTSSSGRLLSAAAGMQMLRNVERSEAHARSTIAAAAEGAWDTLMRDETNRVIAINSRQASASAATMRSGPGAAAGGGGLPRVSTASSGRDGSAGRAGAFPIPPRGGGGGAASHSFGARKQTTAASNNSSGAGSASSTPPAVDAPLSLKEEGNEHYAQRRFLQAHRCYSQAIELDNSNPLLFANRAAVNTMLYNYDACTKDCLRATSIDPRAWKAYARMARAQALLGQYIIAARHYTTALLLLDDGAAGAADSAAARSAIEATAAERGQLQHLERGRLEAEAGNHQTAVGHYNLATHFVDEPPIRLMRFASQLQFAPTVARADLTKYIASQDHPSTFLQFTAPHVSDGEPQQQSQSSSSSPSIIQLLPTLMVNRALHYCATLMLLARASLYSGVHYLNVAAAHLQQCMSIRHDYPGASALLTQLTTFEDRLAAATEAVEAKRYVDAVVNFTEALDAVHETNVKVRSLVLLQRADSYLAIGSANAALEDCTAVLAHDGNNVKALCRRSKAHEALDHGRDALLDLEQAALLDEDLAADVVALRMRLTQRGRRGSGTSGPDPSFFSSFENGGASGRNGGGGAAGSSFRRTGSGSNWSGQYHQQPPAASAPPLGPSLYEALGVPVDASATAIKAAYRKLTLQYHPDKVVKESDAVRARCEMRFKQVAHAYSVLSDAAQRHEYDLGRRY